MKNIIIKLARKKISHTSKNGFSLVELLIVITIFSILSVIGTQIITVSLRSTTKSEDMAVVREDVDYVMNVINRELRNAKAVDCALSTPLRLYYTNADGDSVLLRCAGNVNGEIQLNGSRINSTNTRVRCDVPAVPVISTCNPETPTSSPSVTVNLTARNATNSLSIVTSSINIVLRSF